MPVVALVVTAACTLTLPCYAATTERVSVASDGSQGSHPSTCPAISGDGRLVAFESLSRNLVPGDTNNYRDVFVHDRATRATERVSLASDGSQANKESEAAAISSDGRFVAFQSFASNLAAGDTNNSADIFVHDRATGVTERVSVTSDGGQANGMSWRPSISADGRFVAFESLAGNLVPGDTNTRGDIFVHDRLTGVTERVSIASDGSEANHGSDDPSISGDGWFIAFESYASNLVSGDSNGLPDIFVHDRATGATERVSVTSEGGQANNSSWEPAISEDGRFVAFKSRASNLVAGDTDTGDDIFVRDCAAGTTERVSVASDGSEGNDSSASATISLDGRFVAFVSSSSNLVADDTNNRPDVFIHDRATGATERVSVAFDGGEANEWSWDRPGVSADGRFVTFDSWANNLVADDTNHAWDVFVHDRASPPLLSSGYVTPQAGDTFVRFTWRIKYWHVGNLPPRKVMVAIWSSSGISWRQMWALDPSDTNYLDGKWYTYACYMRAGSYAYRFAAALDAQWGYWPQPAGSYRSGPTVAQGNPVTLTSGYVMPASGTGSTNFTWRVKYWNTNNAAPDDVWVAIWFPTLKKAYWYRMWAYDPGDTNCRDGKWYTFSRRWLPPGVYAYRFAARQGSWWAYWPSPTGAYRSAPTVTP